MTDKRANCRFCGSSNYESRFIEQKYYLPQDEYEERAKYKYVYFIFCNTCGCQGPQGDTPEQAIARWGYEVEAQAPSSSAMAAAREVIRKTINDWCPTKAGIDKVFFAEAMEMALAPYLKHMQIPEGQWIACRERMPEINEFCLLYIEGTSLPVMYGYHQKKGWCSMTHGQYSEESITHWMPLPKAPE